MAESEEEENQLKVFFALQPQRIKYILLKVFTLMTCFFSSFFTIQQLKLKQDFPKVAAPINVQFLSLPLLTVKLVVQFSLPSGRQQAGRAAT